MKPENFLLSSKAEDSPLKGCDFGLSVFYRPGEVFQDIVGSAYYVAPEARPLRLSRVAALKWVLGCTGCTHVGTHASQDATLISQIRRISARQQLRGPCCCWLALLVAVSRDTVQSGEHVVHSCC